MAHDNKPAKPQFAAGDLVRVPGLPKPLPIPFQDHPLRDPNRSRLWHPDPCGSHFGQILEERPMPGWSVIVGQCWRVRLDTGDVVVLSSNMLEPWPPR